MLTHFGWRAVLAIVLSTACLLRDLPPRAAGARARAARPQPELPEEDTDGVAQGRAAAGAGLDHRRARAVHGWTVFNSHYPALFLGGFLFFLGFARATAPYQSRVELRAPLLVGFFLAGLVIHGGLQGWWIAPVLASLTERSCSSARRS